MFGIEKIKQEIKEIFFELKKQIKINNLNDDKIEDLHYLIKTQQNEIISLEKIIKEQNELINLNNERIKNIWEYLKYKKETNK